MRRAASSRVLVLASLPLAAGAQDRAALSAKEGAVQVVVQKSVDAREAKDPKAIEALFTDDATNWSRTGPGAGAVTNW
jgi:hypothetical protein